MANQIWAVDPDSYIILEHFAEQSEEDVLKNAGMMVWGNSNHDYRDVLAGLNFNRSFDAVKTLGRVSYMESHDEERVAWEMKNFGANSGSYNIKTPSVYFNRTKLGATFFFLLPGQKMLWQFQELGYDVELNDDRLGEKPPPWGGNGTVGNYYGDPERQKIYDTYAALIQLRNNNLDLIKNGSVSTNLVGDIRTISIDGVEQDFVIVGNFGISPKFATVNFPALGTWYDYFTDGIFEATQSSMNIPLNPGEFHILTSSELPLPGIDLVPFALPEVTSITENTDEVIVFPNPADQELVISSGLIKEIRLLDVLGREYDIFYQSDENQVRIDVSGLTQGVYKLIYTVQSKIHTKTIQVIH